MTGQSSIDGTVAVDLGGGDIALVDPNQLATVESTALIVTPSQTFSFFFNNAVLTFVSGEPQVVDAALKAALLAQGAPVS